MNVIRNALVGVLAAGLAGCTASAPAPAPTPAQPASDAAQGQEAPPPPMEMQPLEFPGFHELVLPNGLRVIVLEDNRLPVLNLDLYVESGAADEPEPVAGLSGVAAELLTKGTPDRTAEEIARTIEGAGGSLSASASSDYLQVGAGVLSDQAELAFDLLSDVTLRPSFPEQEIEIALTRFLSALQAELAEPGALAQRRFMREVYGEGHPYSRAATPGTIRAVDRDALVRFHREHFRADNALLVISGAISRARAESLARQYFAGWEGGGAPEPAFVEPPARDEPRIYFVHRPGSVQSTIRVGHVGIRPENPDYYPLQVMNRVLGGGTDARLFMILREQKGWTYGAYSQMSRPEDVGYFAATAEVRNEVTDSALVEILNQMRRIREEPVSAAELDAAKSFLTGSFPLRIETPGQIARQIAQNRLLGLPAEALLEYRDRIGAVSADDVQRVAREYVRPDRAVIVVVGDATEVLERIEGIAPVALFGPEGREIERAALFASGPTGVVDPTVLEPVTLTYRLAMQGNPIATSTMTLRREGDNWVAAGEIEGAVSQRGRVVFGTDLAPVSFNQEVRQGPVSIEVDLAVEEGHVRGTMRLPEQMGGEQTVDAAMGEGVLLPEMDVWYLAAAQLDEGASFTVPQFSVQAGRATNVSYSVTGIESVTVPAGTFDAYRVEVSGGPQPMVVYLRAESPHVLLRQEYVGQPLVLELQSIE